MAISTDLYRSPPSSSRGYRSLPVATEFIPWLYRSLPVATESILWLYRSLPVAAELIPWLPISTALHPASLVHRCLLTGPYVQRRRVHEENRDSATYRGLRPAGRGCLLPLQVSLRQRTGGLIIQLIWGQPGAG